MYKIFVNDHPILLSANPEMESPYTSIPIQAAKIKRIIKKVDKGELKYVNLYHKSDKKALNYFKKKLKTIKAGGGVVTNPKQEILFIYRNKKWDLPKGKAEKDETIELTALREVEEETMVEGLKIDHFLTKTYHILKRNGTYKLKETFWYKMSTDYQGPLYPQLNEGITKVKWKNAEKTQKAIQKSYANIVELLNQKKNLFQPENRVK